MWASRHEHLLLLAAPSAQGVRVAFPDGNLTAWHSLLLLLKTSSCLSSASVGWSQRNLSRPSPPGRWSPCGLRRGLKHGGFGSGSGVGWSATHWQLRGIGSDIGMLLKICFFCARWGEMLLFVQGENVGQHPPGLRTWKPWAFNRWGLAF